MKAEIVKFLKRTTSPLRTEIVKLIAPTIYNRYLDYSVIVGRPTITFIKARFQDTPLVGAEIGVAEGDGAELIFNTLNMKRLYLIDPWMPYNDQDMTQPEDRERFANGEKKVRRRMRKYGDHAFILNKPASEAVREVSELDFAFIDGNHSYPFVKMDIKNYYPKVKAGGVCGGHDYSLSGVGQAVDEFILMTNLPLHRQLDDWWVIK